MKKIRIVILLAGVLLFVWVIRRFGFGELLVGLDTLGWRLALPILIIFPGYLFYTISWRLFLQRFDGHSIGFWDLFQIKVSGEAANTLTPLNFAGGDPLRIWLLSRKFPVSISGASVVIDRTLQALAVTTLISIGTLSAMFILEIPTYAKTLLGGTSMFLLMLILFFLIQQTRGLFEKFLKWGSRFKKQGFSERTFQRVYELDQQIAEFYRRDRRLFFVCYLLHCLARLMGIIEIFVLARFLGIPMGFGGALFFSAVIPVTNLLGAIVPGNFGVLEAVVGSLFMVLQWNPADGLALQVARRLRAFFWILIGLVFLLIRRHTRTQNGTDRVTPRAFGPA